MHKHPGLVAKYVPLDREKFNSDLEKHHQVYRPGELDSYELHIQGHFLIEFPFYLDPFPRGSTKISRNSELRPTTCGP